MSVFFFLFMLNFTKGGGYMVVQSIYLNKDNVLKESWQELTDYICKYNGTFRKLKIVIEISSNKVKYYLVTKYKVPPTINSIDDFLIKELIDQNIFDTPKNHDNTLASIMKGADAFVGVSAANLVTKEMVKSMNKNPIIFAMANPTPEISYNDAKEAGAYIVGSGRSDFPNQINNVLAFPGIFKGALKVRASKINEEMKLAASYAIANIIADDELSCDYIVPSAFDKRVVPSVMEAVAEAAIKTNVAKIKNI